MEGAGKDAEAYLRAHGLNREEASRLPCADLYCAAAGATRLSMCVVDELVGDPLRESDAPSRSGSVVFEEVDRRVSRPPDGMGNAQRMVAVESHPVRIAARPLRSVLAACPGRLWISWVG